MSNNWWLYNGLRNKFNAELSDKYDPVIRIKIGEDDVGVFTPTSAEYIISSDVVDKAANLGTSVISYSNFWSSPTMEAKDYAKKLGMTIIPHGGFFCLHQKKGSSIKRLNAG